MEKYNDPLYRYVYGLDDEGEDGYSGNAEPDTSPVGDIEECEDDYTKAKREKAHHNNRKLRSLRRDPEDNRRRNKWGRPYSDRKKKYGSAVCVTIMMSDYDLLLYIANKNGKTLSSLLRHLATINMLSVKRKLLGDFMN